MVYHTFIENDLEELFKAIFDCEPYECIGYDIDLQNNIVDNFLDENYYNNILEFFDDSLKQKILRKNSTWFKKTVAMLSYYVVACNGEIEKELYIPYADTIRKDLGHK